MATSVCVLGLGMMGRPMARVLIGAGFGVKGWNRSALPHDLVDGIPMCRDPREAAQADVCLLMLADSAATDAVLGDLEPHLRSGRLVLDMGSSDPSRSKVHARRLAAKGIGWVDAPVSGGPEGAKTGTLAIMRGCISRDWIVATLTEGLAAQDSPGRESGALEQPILGNGLIAVV